MANFGTPDKYVAPEKINEFVEPLRPLVELGEDTLIPVTFDADKYDAEKLQVQEAGRTLGVSLRVHETDYAEGSGRKTVKTVFRVRPERKRKGDKGDVPAEQEADSAAE